MIPSPSMNEMTVLPQYKRYTDVFMVRGPSTPSQRTGRFGCTLVTEAHSFACIAFTSIAIVGALAAFLLLFQSTSDMKERGFLGGVGFALLGASVCSIGGAIAVGVDSFRRAKAIKERELSAIVPTAPSPSLHEALMY